MGTTTAARPGTQPGARPSTRPLAAALLGLALAAAQGAPMPHTAALPECALGVCALDLDATLAAAPCDGDAVVAAYARASGATLLQCNRSINGARNLAYLFDRTRPAAPAYEFDSARVFSAAALPDLAARGVADAFSFKPLCGARPAAPADGQMLLLERVLDDRGGVCYRTLRAGSDASGVFSRADDGRSSHAEPATRETRARWAALVARVAPLLPAPEAAARPAAVPRDAAPLEMALSTAPGEAARAPLLAASTATRVSALQAFLYELPLPDVTSHTWLDRGDPVTVLETRGPGWAKIRYIGKAGRPIERWVHAADLAGPPAAAPRTPARERPPH